MFYSRHISYLTILIVFSVNDDAACQGFSDWNAFNYVYIEHTPLDGAHSADNWNHVALTYQFLAPIFFMKVIESYWKGTVAGCRGTLNHIILFSDF